MFGQSDWAALYCAACGPRASCATASMQVAKVIADKGARFTILHVTDQFPDYAICASRAFSVQFLSAHSLFIPIFRLKTQKKSREICDKFVSAHLLHWEIWKKWEHCNEIAARRVSFLFCSFFCTPKPLSLLVGPGCTCCTNSKKQEVAGSSQDFSWALCQILITAWYIVIWSQFLLTLKLTQCSPKGCENWHSLVSRDDIV